MAVKHLFLSFPTLLARTSSLSGHQFQTHKTKEDKGGWLWMHQLRVYWSLEIYGTNEHMMYWAIQESCFLHIFVMNFISHVSYLFSPSVKSTSKEIRSSRSWGGNNVRGTKNWEIQRYFKHRPNSSIPTLISFTKSGLKFWCSAQDVPR